KLAAAIKQGANDFPQVVYDFGGPAALGDVEAVRRLVCGLKAGRPAAHAAAPPRAPARPTGLPDTPPEFAARGRLAEEQVARPPAALNRRLPPHRGALVLALGVLGILFPVLAVFAW